MYYSGFVLLSAWFFWLLRGRIAAMGIHWLEATLLFLVGILATSHHIHQQPEELALLLAVGLTAFSLSDNRTLNGLSGLFLPLMLLCKIVTIWPAVFPFVMILATRDRQPHPAGRGQLGRLLGGNGALLSLCDSPGDCRCTQVGIVSNGILA